MPVYPGAFPNSAAKRSEAKRSGQADRRGSVGAARVDLDVAQFVQEQEVQAAVAGDEAGQDAVVGGFDELVDELGGGDVADPTALLAGGQAQADEQVGLAGA